MTAPSIPRIRANTPKVRTGCVSCKSRRIKCDEAQPTCLRCQKANLECKYDRPRSKQPETRPVRDLLPASRARLRSNNGSRLIPRLRTNNLNLKGSDIVYFDAFQNTIVDNLCLNGYTGFWSRTILRESMRDECIRDAVLGIGALYRGMMVDSGQGNGSPSSLWVIPAAAIPSLNRSHRDAIQYYTRSLSRFRNRIASEGSSTPPRTLLIISILFIVFELMQGNVDSVDRIMHKSILTLKDTLISLRPELNPESQIPTALDDEGVREAEYFLARLAGYSALSSPLYPSQWESNAYQQSWPPKSTVPSWSSSVKQIQLAFDQYTTSGLIWCMRTFQGTVIGGPSDSDPVRLQEEQATVNSQANHWYEFLQEKLRQETDPKQIRHWRSLLAQAKVHIVFTTYFKDKEKEELMWDSRLADCREAIDGFEAAMEDWTPAGNISPLFEDQWLPSLRCLASKCRDYEVRMKALALSERLTGLWWHDIAALVGLKILITIEEQDRDENGYIPIKSRLRWSASSWNEDHTEFRVTLIGVITDVERVFTIRQDDNLECLIRQRGVSPVLTAALSNSESGSPMRQSSLPVQVKEESSSPVALPMRYQSSS